MKLERTDGLILLLVLLAMPFAAAAQVIYPEDGWWWNPQEPGRGYMMERQEETMNFMSLHYTEAGDPEWLMIVGEYVPDTTSDLIIGTVTGDVVRATHGQCIGCEHVTPLVTVSEQGTIP